jgi:molybdenum cofactor cytidylyltransferase
VAALADGLPVTVIRNAHPELGQRETLRLGVTSSDAAFYLFFPCDQPFLDAATVRALVAARREGAIVQPRCCGEPSTPVIFSRAFRQEILGLNPGEHGRDLKTRHPEAVVPVDFDDPRLFMDVDTP